MKERRCATLSRQILQKKTSMKTLEQSSWLVAHISDVRRKLACDEEQKMSKNSIFHRSNLPFQLPCFEHYTATASKSKEILPCSRWLFRHLRDVCIVYAHCSWSKLLLQQVSKLMRFRPVTSQQPKRISSQFFISLVDRPTTTTMKKSREKRAEWCGGDGMRRPSVEWWGV